MRHDGQTSDSRVQGSVTQSEQTCVHLLLKKSRQNRFLNRGLSRWRVAERIRRRIAELSYFHKPAIDSPLALRTLQQIEKNVKALVAGQFFIKFAIGFFGLGEAAESFYRFLHI